MSLGIAASAQAGGFGPMGMMNPMGWFNGDDDRYDGRRYPLPPAYGYPVQPPGYAPYPPAYQWAPQPPAAAAPVAKTPQARAVAPVAKEPDTTAQPVKKEPALANHEITGTTSAPAVGQADKQPSALGKARGTYDPSAPVFRPLDKE